MPTDLPAYITRAIAQLQAAGQVQPGTVVQVAVLHDDWCTYHDTGACTCEPDVRIEGAPHA